MTTHLLIDADYPLIAASTAAQKNIDWGDGVTTAHASLEDAQRIFEEMLQKIYRVAWEADHVDHGLHLCFSCPTRRYFRHDIDPEYKGHRRGGPRPLLVQQLREWVEQNYYCWTRPNLEADDVIGILATHPKLIEGKKIVVSVDKDLHQIPGRHINPQKPHLGVHEISHEAGRRQLAIQVLTGDTVDGYKGCPGIGVKRATRIVEAGGAAHILPILATYLKAGCTEEYFTQQYNLARILQYHCYDFKRKEPVLWRLEKD